MAIADGKSPIVFDATNQSVSRYLRIACIRAIRGDTDGTVELQDSTGYPLFMAFLDQTNANSMDEVHLPAYCGHYHGAKVVQIPDNAKVYVYYE